VAVGLNVGHALVSNTAGNVWTQSVTHGTKVVLSVQAEVVAFDFLVTSTVVGTGVVGLVVGGVQRQIVGQEVTDRCAWVEAVFNVINAVVVLFFVKQFTLDRALPCARTPNEVTATIEPMAMPKVFFSFIR